MEREFLDWLRQRARTGGPVQLGIGDDAAIIRGADFVVTSDMLMDGVHFRCDSHPAEQIGHKAIAVNLSDLAAMAAEPVAAVVSLAVPNADLELAKRLILGMEGLCDQFQTVIVGGDTNCWDGPLVISVTAFGHPPPGGCVRRDGARPGDKLLATGSFGNSIAGKHLDFTPRIVEARTLRQLADLHAMMDVSDGLSLDASRMASASGCGVVLDLNRIPAEQGPYEDGRSPMDHALSDGEDFELLIAVAESEAVALLDGWGHSTPLTAIGEFVDAPGLYVDDDGKRRAISVAGYEHGRSSN